MTAAEGLVKPARTRRRRIRDISLSDVGRTFSTRDSVGPTASVKAICVIADATTGRSLGGAMIRSRRRRASVWRFRTSAASEPANTAVVTNTIAMVTASGTSTPRP